VITAFCVFPTHDNAVCAIPTGTAPQSDATESAQAIKTERNLYRIFTNGIAGKYDSQVIDTHSPAESSQQKASPVTGLSANGSDSWVFGDRSKADAGPLSERVALLLLLITVVVAPFPYGAITSGGTLALEILAFTTVAATFFGRPRLAPLKGVWIPISALLVIVLLGLAQLVPLPSSVLQRISPVSAQIYRDAAKVLGLFRHAAPAEVARTVPTKKER